MARVYKGKSTSSDLLVLNDVTNQIAGHTICPFGDALVTPVRSFIEKFPDEFQDRIDAAVVSSVGNSPSSSDTISAG